MVHVMSEVKRFKASDLHVACCGDTIVVNAEDFDARDHAAEVYFGSWKRTEQELDAQRLRADTAEAERNQLLNDPNSVFKKMCDMALKQRDEAMSKLAAAEQRIASHESTLRHFANCADVRQVGTSAMAYVAALNPSPEAESHE